jgi:small-conductance mechanosensitive channel
MIGFLREHPDFYDLLISAAILAASWVVARVGSALVAKLFRKGAARTAITLDDHLVESLSRSITYALFLVGAYIAVHRLPIQDAWTHRIDQWLFATGVVVAAVTLARVYRVVLDWYTTEARHAAEGLATEFGPLLSKVGNVLIVVIATITLLQHFGINVQSLVVSLGVGSLAVGLAAQDTLSNMFAGFTLMLDRPFRTGDRIQLNTGEVGDVIGIGMRATRIKTPAETILIVPNALLVKDRLTNLSQPTRHLTTRAEIAVVYGSDMDAAKAILTDAVRGSAHIDPDRPPAVLVTRVSDFSLGLAVVFWVKDYAQQGAALSDVYEEIYRRLVAAGIEIAVPTQRVIPETPPKLAAGPGDAPPGKEPAGKA